MRVARVLDSTQAEGPGIRTAVWVQGCSIRCPGCFNPQFWTTRGGTLVHATTLADDLITRAQTAGAEGITFLGGEPFEQAAALSTVAKILRAANFSVMTFSGYIFEDLKKWSTDRTDIAELLAATDLLVDGPYLSTAIDRTRPWVGSTNQRFHMLTDRYKMLLASLDHLPDRLEIRIGSDGTVTVNGWADPETLDALFSDLAPRRSYP
ncbi:MAG: radical SAM protein [Pseudonocardiales bacterium]|nr:radical SAM protein [Pseudonocardiales bacterium]